MSFIPFRRIFFVSLCFAVTLVAMPASNPAKAIEPAEDGKIHRPPNVIVILSDDQGWGDLSCNGNKNLSTPHIDSLAKQGARFEQFYVCPVCSPTRAEFLTGRYHPRGGVYSTSAGGERLDADEATIAESFKAAGYATAAFGKWHNGMQYPYHPNARGFDEYYGFCSGHWGNYFSPMLEHNGEIVTGNGFVIDDFTDHAMKFISSHRETPFFIYLPYNTPHSPMQVPDRWWNKFKDKKLEMHNREPRKENLGHIRAALAMCENIDWNVGRLLNHLEKENLANETIVLYFCDNGPNGVRWNADMKGRKGSTDEGGVRSPLVIRWPGKIQPATKVTQIAAAIDLLPTLTDLAGIEIQGRKPLDGKSLKSLLTKSTNQGVQTNKRLRDRMIFSHWRSKVSVRTQKFRLDHQGRLFDMDGDPGQRTDISASNPEVTGRLRDAVTDWKKNVLSELKQSGRPFVIGHPDAKYTQIPARDGKGSGQIQRSNRFPNCSYFANWTSTDESIAWPAHVPADGVFDVDIYYTCAKSDVGSEIELSFGESRLRSKINEPHDPPIIGANEDRVKRAESYVKDFKRMKMGRIQLKAGAGELKLSAISIPGSQVMEFRLLMLTRVNESNR